MYPLLCKSQVVTIQLRLELSNRKLRDAREYAVTRLLVEISDILRVTQEGQSGDVPALVPPLADTSGNVDLREIHPGRPRYPRQPYKQRGARGHVRVLHVSGYGPGISEVLVVEKASDHVATGE